MPGKDNLVSLADRTTEEQREIAKKGGKASGEARRKNQTLKQVARMILYAKAPPSMSAALEQCGIPEDERTNLTALIAGQVVKAAEGDTRAARYLMEIIGEDPHLKLDAEKLKLLKLAHEEVRSTLTDDWVNSIPETPSDDFSWGLNMGWGNDSFK